MPPPGAAFIGMCGARQLADIGDLGQASAVAAAGSSIAFSGPLGISIPVSNPRVHVSTTASGAILHFADFEATFDDTAILGVSVGGPSAFMSHTFDAALQPDGTFSVPEQTAAFLLTAVVGGFNEGFSATNTTALTGTYDEARGVFTLSGTIQDAGSLATAVLDLTFAFTNRPPVAVIAAQTQVQCTSPAGATVQLSGAGSTDPDGFSDIKTFGWIIDKGSAAQQVLSGVNVFATLALGPHSVTLEVRDSQFSFSVASTTISVVNNEPPVFTLVSASPSCLWPPNHRMVLFELGRQIVAEARSTCDAKPASVTLSAVSDNQSFLGGGSGDAAPDFSLGPAAACLRAERDGTSATPRIYTLTLTARAQSGPPATATVEVTVPHDQAHGQHCPRLDPSLSVSDGDPRCAPVGPDAGAGPPSVEGTLHGVGAAVRGQGCSSTGASGWMAGALGLLAMASAWRARRKVSADTRGG